jgi:hypothetical protein
VQKIIETGHGHFQLGQKASDLVQNYHFTASQPLTSSYLPAI